MDRSKEIDEFLERDSDEVSRVLKLLDDSRPLPFHIPLFKVVDFAVAVEKVLKIVQEETNPRIIVIECWLLLDYCIRNLLNSGLQLDRFDPKVVTLLPNSLYSCINLLRKLRDDQMNKTFDPYPLPSSLNPSFFNFLHESKPDLFDAFAKAEMEFMKDYPPVVLSAKYEHEHYSYRQVESGWMERVGNLSDDWFNKAIHLNKVRNKAAHSFDPETIYSLMEVKGEDRQDRLRNSMVTLFDALIPLKK